MKVLFEEWDKYYNVTKSGIVTRLSTGRELRHRINEKGYPTVSLSFKGKSFYRPVHRLVALKHIPNPENKPCVNHKDRNRANTNSSNLEWVTHSENVVHSVANGGRANYTRPKPPESCYAAVLDREKVQAIRDLATLGYSGFKLGRIFNVKQHTISKVINFKTWKVES